MKNKLDQIEQQLRDETPPLTASSIPDANVLLTEFRRSQTYRRTVMSIATAIVVVVAAGYLTRLGTLSLRDGNKTVAENSDVLNSDVETRTAADSINMITTNVERKSPQNHKATGTDSWLVELGEMNEDELIPLILSRYGHDGAGGGNDNWICLNLHRSEKCRYGNFRHKLRMLSMRTGTKPDISPISASEVE